MPNEKSLQTLTRAIRLSQGEFSLIFLRCNYISLQKRIAENIQQISTVKIREINLPTCVKTLYTTLLAELGDEKAEALMVFGLESVKDLDTVLTSANQVREEFRKNFSFPLIIWVNDFVLQKLIRLATDLENWATTIEFTFNNDELIGHLCQIINDIIDGNVNPNHQICWELETARQELQQRGYFLEPKDQANLDFVLGLRDYAHDEINSALEYYQTSLHFWQKTNNLETQGILLLHIGLAYHQKSSKNQADSQFYRNESRNYLVQALEAFEKAQRLDLVAQYISKLCEVLRISQAWDELEDVAKKSLALHKTYGNSLQLAQDYGFLAEAALEKSLSHDANKFARQALKTLDKIPQLEVYERGWYDFILARSQKDLGAVAEAIENLENLKNITNPQCNPKLYISVLETLRLLYFEQCQYLNAFRIKQEQIAIEHQYGFRAFIGAAYLHPKRYAVNPELVKLNQHNIVAQEIAASRRQQDVNNLIERLSRNDHKLTIIHGQSGVGKSSILKAGLIPALQEKAVGERDALPIVVRVYADWLGNLAKHLFEKNDNIQVSNIIEKIIEKLWENIESNLLTILIFDQFEEFFFAYPEQNQRQQFYEFLRLSLDIPFVKIILSLREDYLHHLLEFERLGYSSTINNNILDKNIRYHLGRFSQEDAKAVVKSLTEKAHLYLESELIDELVEDLASEFGEVSPIELQIVGAQLQTDRITTLEKYRQLGTKERLVGRFLEEVIKDCGIENQGCARLVLYLLTNENGTRPFKTRDDLLTDLKALDLVPEVEKLDMVLEVLVGSGLVCEIPEIPAASYQLVHDYLVSFIRQQQAPELLAELAATKEKQKLTEQQLRQALREKEKALRQEQQQRQRAEIAEIEALISLSQALFLSHDQLGALVAAVKAGIQLQGTEVSTWVKERAVARIVQVVTKVQECNRFEGHSNWVTSVSFSSDGKIIASASANRTVRLWNIDGSLLYVLQGHRDVVWDVCFSPGGKVLASASGDGTIKIWSRNGSLLHTFVGHSESVFSVAFNPTGNVIVSASADKTIKFWSIKGTLLKTIQAHTDEVLSVCYSPDGNIVASGSADKTIKLWNIDTDNWHKNGQLLKTINAHNSSVNCVIFTPDRKTIISASDDHTIKLWNIKGVLQKTLKEHTASVNRVTVSTDGKIASVSSDKTVKLWNRDGRLLTTFLGHTDDIYGIDFSSDRNTLVSGSADKTLRLWNKQGAKPMSLKLEDLVTSGCQWLGDYLKTNPNVRECDRNLCEEEKKFGIGD
jgi:WD40 repeat protein